MVSDHRRTFTVSRTEAWPFAADAQFAEQPLVQAQLLAMVGETLRTLWLLDLARDPTQRTLSIRRAELGDEHPDTLISIGEIARLLQDQGRFDEAEP